MSELNAQQLDRVRAQLEEELQMLTNSASELKMVQKKLTNSKESLGSVTLDNNGKSILVPLTSSMYVPGRISTDAVLVDVGTNYFVEKDKDAAEKFFQRKIDYVTSNLEKIQQILIDKHKVKESVTGHLLQKVSAMQEQKTGT